MSRNRRAILSLLAVLSIAAGLGQSNVLAQTPSPTGAGAWPFRVAITGPATATPGQQVTYTVTYDKVDARGSAPPSFVFHWDARAASFVSSKVVSGPAGTMNQVPPDSVRWDFSQSQSGAVEVELAIGSAVNGDLHVGIFVPGTGITLPPGSVDQFSTRVAGTSATASPPSVAATPGVVTLPSTGESSTNGGRWLILEIVLGIVGAVVVITGFRRLRTRTLRR